MQRALLRECTSHFVSEMQSVAVLNAVCRRWKASLSLIEAQVASISYASQALSSESVTAREVCGNQSDGRSNPKPLCAASCTGRSDLTSSLLTPQWLNGERRRQVLNCLSIHNIRPQWLIHFEISSSIAVLYNISQATCKHPTACLLANPRAARQTATLCTSHALRQANR